MTCELHPKLPLPLLRVSEVIVFEASTGKKSPYSLNISSLYTYIHTYIYTLDCNIFVGIKANIQRFYNSVPAARIDKQPAERVRMYGLLAWFNAVIQERLRCVVQQLRMLYTYVNPTHIHLCYVDTRRLVSPRSTSSPRRIRMYLWTSSTSGWTM